MGNILDVIFDEARDLDFYAVMDIKALPEDIEQHIRKNKKREKKQKA
ncbi:MAG: hypothetical protein IKW39_01460 [Alphaproteobacteria bacterium]|nr:hypothetical protein [Alphaproteobacteria bacterium]